MSTVLYVGNATWGDRVSNELVAAGHTVHSARAVDDANALVALVDPDIIVVFDDPGVLDWAFAQWQRGIVSFILTDKPSGHCASFISTRELEGGSRLVELVP